jgi:hypothetical protein
MEPATLNSGIPSEGWEIVRMFFLNLAHDFVLGVLASITASIISPYDMIGFSVAVIFAFVGVVRWHRTRIKEGKRGMDSWYFISLVFLIAIACFGVGIYGVGLRTAQPARASAQPQPDSAAASPVQSGVPNSVLVASRYYSSKNKEEVAERLDRISTSINVTGEELFKEAEIAINSSPWESAPDMGPYIARMNHIIDLSGAMKTDLYDHLVDGEREYRVEINAILFPQEPFLEFKMGAEQFRDGLTVWGKTRNSDSRDEILKLVQASRITFAVARNNFLNWVGRRTEIIGQTRRALKS